MKLYRLIIPSILASLIIATTMAQEVRVRAELDTNKALIGDQLNLRLTVEKSPALQVNFPALSKALSADIEILNVKAIDTSAFSANTITLIQELLITVFDTGFFEIPSLPFVVMNQGSPDTMNTLPVYFQVFSVKADSTIRDIKAVYKVPLGFRDFLPYLLLLTGIGLIAWLLYIYYTNRKSIGKLLTTRNTHESPDVLAVKELEQLRAEKPWMQNRVKYFYIRISEVLRVYIEHRFKVPALERTTDEILESLKDTSCSASEISRLASVLKLADLVKFAKVLPEHNESELQIDAAVGFVVETSKSLEPAPSETTNETLINNSNRSS
jgi:hypothetical protein